MKSRLFALLVLPLLLAAGCGSGGSSGSGSGDDPAKLVPASAPAYVSAVVRPDGSLGDDADAALKKLLRTGDPGAKVVGLFNQAVKDDGISWDDVKPWLGRRVGLFVAAPIAGDDTPQAAAIIDTTDTGKAQATLTRVVTHPKNGGAATTLTKGSYKGVEVDADAAGKHALAIVGDSAVVGTANAIHQVIDVSKGARPLSDVADYTDSLKAASADDGLLSAYVVPQGAIDLIKQVAAGTSGQAATQARMLGYFRQAVAKAGRAAGVALHADGDALRVQGASLGAPASPQADVAASTLAALPADAWLAAGLGDIGTTLTRNLDQLSQLTAGTKQSFDLSGVMARFKNQTGIDIQKDFLSWMGSGALYARGSGLTDIGGALTVTSKDPAKSHKAVLLLARALSKAGVAVQQAEVPGYDSAIQIKPGASPIAMLVAAGGDHFSIGINPQALTDIIKPSARLSSARSFQSATKALGDGIKPVFLLDTPTIVNLLETFGVAGQPGFARAKPYLDAFGPLSLGSGRDGDITKTAFAVGLR